jgi:hypothetical protein
MRHLECNADFATVGDARPVMPILQQLAMRVRFASSKMQNAQRIIGAAG